MAFGQGWVFPSGWGWGTAGNLIREERTMISERGEYLKFAWIKLCLYYIILIILWPVTELIISLEIQWYMFYSWHLIIWFWENESIHRKLNTNAYYNTEISKVNIHIWLGPYILGLRKEVKTIMSGNHLSPSEHARENWTRSVLTAFLTDWLLLAQHYWGICAWLDQLWAGMQEQSPRVCNSPGL